MWIRGAYLESLFAGRGEHFDISAEYFEDKRRSKVNIWNKGPDNIISTQMLILRLQKTQETRNLSDSVNQSRVINTEHL